MQVLSTRQVYGDGDRDAPAERGVRGEFFSIRYDWGKDDEHSSRYNMSRYNGFKQQAFFWFAHYVYLTRVIRDFVLAEGLFVVAGVRRVEDGHLLRGSCAPPAVRDFGENWTNAYHDLMLRHRVTPAP